MSFEETVLSISGKPFTIAFRVFQAENPPSSNFLYCPYSEMKHYVETVFKQWIKKRIAEADEVPVDKADEVPVDRADAVPVYQARQADPLIRFYEECDASREVFETWVKEACGIFNIAKPPPDAGLPPARDFYVDAYYM